MTINFYQQKLKNNGKRGFTLIELMVATTIFTSVILMALGSLLVSIDGTKKAQALRVSMDNVNFAMDSMSRNLRTGTNYYCKDNVSKKELIDLNESLPSLDCEGANAVAFKPGGNDGPVRILYRINSGKLEKCVPGASNNCQSLVADNVTIDQLKFYVKGTKSGDATQPSVYLKMKGSVLIRGVSTPFFLQTLASQRAVID